MVCKAIKEIKKGFKERKSTVFKKAKELSTLCDVDLLLIFYEAHQPNVPQFWCSKPDGANHVISRYYAEKKTELNQHNNKVKRGDNNNEFIKDLGIEDLNKLAGILEGKIKSVNDRINYCNGNFQVTESLNFGNFSNQMVFDDGYDGRVEDVGETVNRQTEAAAQYDGMWDTSLNLDDDVVVNSVNQIEAEAEGYNSQIDGMNSTVLTEDRMMLDMGLQHLLDYDECFNLDDVVFGGYNCSNTAQVELVNSGNVLDCDSLLGSHVHDDDLHNLLMQFDVDDFSLGDFEF